MKKIAMIGVGKLGQDCAEVMADAGFDVVGYDVVARAPAFPMRNSIEETVIDRDIIFIAAPTPHDPIYGGETPTSQLPNKDFDYTIVTNILNEVNQHVNKNQLVVLISTVLPGTVRRVLEPCITNARFIYNPYLIAMGTIKWDMVNPEMVIIGTDDGSQTGDANELIDFYRVFMQNNPRYVVGTWDEAESIKIFYNTFISTKLALVNMIQDVAETNGNINVDVVTTALAESNYRITGPAYMKAGFGDAGACHPRDNIALRYLADRLDLGYDLFDSIMRAREVQAERMALRCLKNGKNITIVGKAYKPAVPYTIGSASMLVGHYIEKHGGNLHYYDPNTGDNDLREEWTEVYLIGYWEEWVRKLSFKYPETVVIDPWRKLTSSQHTGEIIYYGNSRPQKTYVVPMSTLNTMRQQVYEMLPNLAQYDSVIHLIDATINNDTMFIMRPTEDLINELITAKKNGKTKFIFFACTEALMPHVIGKIQRILNLVENIIDANDMFMITSVPDGDHVYSQLHAQMEWTKKINLLNCNFVNFITTTYARDFEFIGGYEARHKSKKFTCFNKVNREHRMRLVDRMLAANLVDDAFYSFEGEGDFKKLIPTLDDVRYSNIKLNEDKFPIRLNITPDRSNPTDIQPDDLGYYRESYFSVVTETLFYEKKYSNGTVHHRPYVEDSMFLTEKTYRCFALLHPFILMTRPYALVELRKQGYKTFTPFIDESYDSIEDDDKRFDAIVDEIFRLCRFNGNDWMIWQQGIREIVEFNQNWFHTNRKFNFTENYQEFFTDAPSAPYTKPIQVATVFTTPMPEITSINDVVEHTETSIQIVNSDDQLYDILDWNNKRVVYDNGVVLNFPNHIDGAGDSVRKELLKLIDHTGKDHYERALDWCAGHGPFGFELLDAKKATTVVFQDIYKIAIDTCMENARDNSLLERVTGYVCSSINEMPDSEKFDLVVANPPHSNTDRYLDRNGTYENTKRIIVDIDYQAHREFFTHIRKYLVDAADVYITVSSENNHQFIEWASVGGLNHVGFFPLQALNQGGLLHFKARNN